MGWAQCGDDSKGRPIGYAVAATCDHPGCCSEIDRGLGYACGGMHGTGTLGGDSKVDWDSMDIACEGYFCGEHLRWPCFEHEDGTDLYAPQLCFKCAEEAERLYRADPDWRDLWPTMAEPVSAQAMSASGQDPEGLEAEGPPARSPSGDVPEPFSGHQPLDSKDPPHA